jgi:hypothetical protein
MPRDKLLGYGEQNGAAVAHRHSERLAPDRKLDIGMRTPDLLRLGPDATCGRLVIRKVLAVPRESDLFK